MVDARPTRHRRRRAPLGRSLPPSLRHHGSLSSCNTLRGPRGPRTHTSSRSKASLYSAITSQEPNSSWWSANMPQKSWSRPPNKETSSTSLSVVGASTACGRRGRTLLRSRGGRETRSGGAGCRSFAASGVKRPSEAPRGPRISSTPPCGIGAEEMNQRNKPAPVTTASAAKTIHRYAVLFMSSQDSSWWGRSRVKVVDPRAERLYANRRIEGAAEDFTWQGLTPSLTWPLRYTGPVTLRLLRRLIARCGVAQRASLASPSSARLAPAPREGPFVLIQVEAVPVGSAGRHGPESDPETGQVSHRACCLSHTEVPPPRVKAADGLVRPLHPGSSLSLFREACHASFGWVGARRACLRCVW